MIDVITSKITKLVAQAAQGDPKVDEDEALRAFEGFILNQCKTVPITTTDQDEGGYNKNNIICALIKLYCNRSSYGRDTARSF